MVTHDSLELLDYKTYYHSKHFNLYTTVVASEKSRMENKNDVILLAGIFFREREVLWVQFPSSAPQIPSLLIQEF
jgi:hypothetical protein